MATLAAMGRRQITADDPRAGDVQALLQRHLEFAHATTPPEGVHALDTGGLLDPAVTFFSLRQDDELIAIGALKELDARHGEVKSMHTAAAARGSGAGRAMLAHIIGVAAQRGYERLSLETGSMAAFGPARALYASAGFTLCGPFGALPAECHEHVHDPRGPAGPSRPAAAVRAGCGAETACGRGGSAPAGSARRQRLPARQPAQKWLPDIELPPTTPKPCSANTIPATVSTVPMSTSHPLSKCLSFRRALQRHNARFPGQVHRCRRRKWHAS